MKRKKGGVLVALEDGMYSVDLKSGVVEKLIRDPEEGNEKKRYNDGKCSPNGSFYIGSLDKGEKFEENPGSLYRIDCQHNISKVVEGVGCSNGIAWRSDKKKVYYIDSTPKSLYSFDFDEKTEEWSNKKTVKKWEEMIPDGCTIDSEDKLWIAFWASACVCRVDPESGETLEKISVPAKNCTSVALGGKQLRDLYITSATCEGEEDLGGSLFVLRQVDVPGVESFAYAG